MGACSECQARIEHHVNGIFIRHVAPAWADPQTLAKLHRMEVVHPLAFPVFVFKLFDFVRKTGAQQRMIFQNRDHFGHISFGIKQADDVGVAPQAGFTRQRFKHRGVMRVLEGDRDRTGLHQRITHLFGIRAGCVQFQLDPRHGKTLYLSVEMTAGCGAD